VLAAPVVVVEITLITAQPISVPVVLLAQEQSQEMLVETVIAVIQVHLDIQITQMERRPELVVAPRAAEVALVAWVLDSAGQILVQPITLH
jgi:hypothetical protein